MRLTRLEANSFRNLVNVDLDTNAQFVVFHGDNAQGKTNTLEAIYLLTTLKPLRARQFRELISWEQSKATVAGWMEVAGLSQRYEVQISPGKKRVMVGEKQVSQISDYFGRIRSVSFTPTDTRIISGEPSRRRKWVDRAAFTLSPLHLDVVKQWKRILDQRSALLKSDSFSEDVFDALTHQFVRESVRLVERRNEIVDLLRPYITETHRRLSGSTEELSIRYRACISGDSHSARIDHAEKRITGVRKREISSRRVQFGPQMDDIDVLLDGKSVRSFGSQGQIRSLVLSLKVAELLAARDRGEVPIFLIDDVGSELDSSRKERLIGILSELDVQVFVTTTDEDHLVQIPRDKALFYRLEKGAHLKG